MSPAFLVYYVIGRRQITKVKADRCKETIRAFLLECTSVLYEYVNSLRNDVNNTMFELKYIGNFNTVLFI